MAHRPRSEPLRRAARLRVGLALLACCLPVSAQTAGFSFTASFTRDDEQRAWYFTLAEAGTVTVRTYSYGGGTAPDGTPAAPGGFDPTLSVFDAGGNLIAVNRDGGCAAVNADTTTGLCFDASISLTLPAGAYRLVATQGENLPNGPTIADSFAYDGQPFFTVGPESPPNTPFQDVTGVQRSGLLTVGILGASNAFSQLAISSQTPPGGKVQVAYSYQFQSNGGAAPNSWTLASGALPPGVNISESGLLSGTPTTAGTYDFTLQVSDTSSPQMSDSHAFEIVVAPQDLTITSSTLPTWIVGKAFSQTLTASGGIPPYTWSLAGSAVGGVSIGSDGTVSGTPPAAGAFSIPAQVTDSASAVVQAPVSWQVNPPLIITSASTLPPGITQHQYGGFAFTAQGGAAAQDTWSLANGSSLPGGMALSAAGAFTGTPAAHNVYTFTVQASDGVQPATQTVTFGVYDPLSITTSSLPSGTVGTGVGSIALGATGGSGTYAWSASGLPPGLAVSAAGVLTGSPTAAGNFQVAISLHDTTANQTAQATLSMSVSSPPPLQISSNGGNGVAVGSVVSKTFTATGGKPPYSWSGSGLPAWLSIDAASGVLSGTASAAGVFSFSIQVTDAQPATTSVSVTFGVLGITTSSLPNATTVSTYSQSITAAGGTPPYSFSGSGLPAGMSVSAAGTLAGTPKAAGIYPIAIQVSDAAGISASSTLSLTVTAPVDLQISAGGLSGGQIGKSYSDTLSASGGSPPYTWAILAGTLPDGLSAAGSGTISGTPTTAGTYAFTAQATDRTGATASGPVSIAIAPIQLTFNGGTLPSAVAGADYPPQVLAAQGGVGPYTYTLEGSLPAGLTFSAGQISGKPKAAGTDSFTVIATDSSVPPVAVRTSVTILTRPAQADLILSASSVLFDLKAKATGLPPGANITVQSSQVQQALNFGVEITQAAPWLSVSGGGSTPGGISIALNDAALSLAPASAAYETTVAVNCLAPSPCAGAKQTVAVSLSVTAPPPQLSFAPALLSFAVDAGNPVAVGQSLSLQNTGAGTIGIKSLSAADGWVTLSGVTGSIAAGPGVNVAVGVNPDGLQPGFYRSTISIETSAGSASVPVSFLYAKNALMTLNPGGSQFPMQESAAPGNASGSFAVSVSGNKAVNWTASAPSAPGWLKVTTTGGSSTATSPGAVGFSIDAAAAAALTPGPYYGEIQVASGDVTNSPQSFEVVLDVSPKTDPVKPDPEPAGLLFLAGGPGAIPPRTVSVFAGSKTPVTYQASAASESGNWLSVSPASGSTSTATPGQSSVSVDITGLTPGVYRGGVSYAFSSAAVRTVNVTLIVPAGDVARPNARQVSRAQGTCAPIRLVPTQTGLVNNFQQPTAWPTPLTVQLTDDCGTPVGGGQVVATFSNGDPPLPLAAIDKTSGLYSGTWTPRATAAQVTISARATAANFPATTVQITGQVNPNSAPVLTPHGTLHVFAPQLGAPLGPGSIVQIYGSNLAAQTSVAGSLPLPTSLGKTSVLVGGIPAPLYFVSPGQINAQLPYELEADKPYQILVNANGALATPDAVQIADVSPGIAAFANGSIISQHLDGSLVTDDAPAKPGEVLVIYLAGLGATDLPIATGAAAPLDQLLHPQDPPTLSIDGAQTPTLFAGLTPGLVGLYQVNFRVPDDARSGGLALVISQNGSVSNQTVLPVKR